MTGLASKPDNPETNERNLPLWKFLQGKERQLEADGTNCFDLSRELFVRPFGFQWAAWVK
jgi:hypothetical protein